jgi:hypothetical protein
VTGKRRYTPDEKASYFTLRDRGWTRAAAAREIGCSYDTAIAWDKLRSRPSGHVSGARKKDSIQFMRGIEPPPPLVPGRDHLNEHALRALDDFEFFRARYLGHLSTPWQIEAAETMVRLLKTPEKEWVVVNCPPGSGKTTLFSLDIPLWLIVRDRAVRIFVGSRTFKMASTYTGRIRNMLARTMPAPPDEENIAKGLAVEPTGCLAVDFGRFRPEAKELWRRDEFVVEQTSGEGSVEKEATVTAWGRDTDFLGFRADFVVWDDLVTSKGLKTIEAIEADREWFEDEAETRLEPGGVFCLQGQRMGPEDLYRHALNMRTGDEDEVESPPKYRHIVYKAHYEDVCRQLHKRTDPPYDPKNPESGGCLLDPRRLLWSELQTARRNRESKYRVQYQQEDVDPSRVLVRKAWIDGGTDPEDGSICPGCWDDRNILEVPNGLVPPVSVEVLGDRRLAVPSGDRAAVPAEPGEAGDDRPRVPRLQPGRVQRPDARLAARLAAVPVPDRLLDHREQRGATLAAAVRVDARLDAPDGRPGHRPQHERPQQARRELRARVDRERLP